MATILGSREKGHPVGQGDYMSLWQEVGQGTCLVRQGKFLSRKKLPLCFGLLARGPSSKPCFVPEKAI